MLKQPSCGFGESYHNFFVGTNSTYLTPSIKNCLGNNIYGPTDASYTNVSYPPDILRPPYGYSPTQFGKKKKVNNVYELEIKYLKSLKNGTR
jgi:hypothetical protein